MHSKLRRLRFPKTALSASWVWVRVRTTRRKHTIRTTPDTLMISTDLAYLLLEGIVRIAIGWNKTEKIR